MTAITEGLHHLGLTVTDVEGCAQFFCNQLGFTRLGEKPDYPAVFVGDGTIMLTLWQVQVPEPAAFDRRTQVGLHHFALNLKNETSLNALYEALSQRSDVTVEFAPEPLGSRPMKHMMCQIPGDLRVEFICPVASA